MDPVPTVDIDADCDVCGYNLRGLRLDARCPECGYPVHPHPPIGWLLRRAAGPMTLADWAGRCATAGLPVLLAAWLGLAVADVRPEHSFHGWVVLTTAVWGLPAAEAAMLLFSVRGLASIRGLPDRTVTVLPLRRPATACLSAVPAGAMAWWWLHLVTPDPSGDWLVALAFLAQVVAPALCLAEFAPVVRGIAKTARLEDLSVRIDRAQVMLAVGMGGAPAMYLVCGFMPWRPLPDGAALPVALAWTAPSAAFVLGLALYRRAVRRLAERLRALDPESIPEPAGSVADGGPGGRT